MTSTDPARKRSLLPPALFAAASLATAVWIANTWSLSSYAIVLEAFGARDTGIVLGEPRRVRSDEWGALTPLIQATVNNGFRRINDTSFYHEDLRNAVALPIADWGLIFKPDEWLYPFVNAAYAFSFQHLVYIATFLIGYALLLRRVGIQTGTAVLLSAALFFTAFVQFWWTTFAPNLAYFPWVLLGLGVRRPTLRSAAFFWTAVVWMLGYFYPPIFIPLAVAAIAVYWSALYPERGVRGAALDGLVALAACGVVVFYLRDYLVATWHSLYPGQRSMEGGGIPAAMQWQTLWPTAYLTRFESDIPGFDVCAASVIGSWYFLMVICFVDYRQLLATTFPPRTRRILLAAIVGFLVLLCWQSLPLPPQVAKWILFDRVPPMRTMFASGFLLLLAAALVVDFGVLRFSARRLLAFGLAAVLGWGMAKGALRPVPAPSWAELAVIPVAFAVLAAGWARPRLGAPAIAGGAALLGLLAFGPFNPIQSAWPIFNRESTALTREFDRLQRENPFGVLVSDQFGATLNGWGYRSAAHVLITPQPDFWRRLLPDMDATVREGIFNRFAHIVVRYIREPQLISGQVIAVPSSMFGDRSTAWFSVQPLRKGVSWDRRGGHLDTLRIDGGRLLLAGWAPWRLDAADQMLTLYTDAPLTATWIRRIERPDVTRALGDQSLQYGGFAVELEFQRGGAITETPLLCLVARDAASGAGVLIEPGAPECDAHRR